MALSRRKFLTTATLGSAALALRPRASAEAPPPAAAARTTPRAPTARPRQPNLLFLWSDQHRHDALPFTGSPAIQAPHLAALAEKSFVFDQAYCTHPVCTPSRSCVLTGVLPHNNGSIDLNIPLVPAVKTIAEYVGREYANGYHGKWHLGHEFDTQRNWQDWVSLEDIYAPFYRDPKGDPKRRSSYHHFLWQHGFRPDLVETPSGEAFYSEYFSAGLSKPFTKSIFLAGEAERFLRQRKDGRPFVLSVSTLEPHPPNYGPNNDLYDPDTLPNTGACGRPVGPDASRLHRLTGDFYRDRGFEHHSLTNAWDLRRLRANYYGQVSLIDEAFGRVLRALEESGQADNTIIVYTSDHGEMLGDHALFQKSVFYEKALRVPLMIHVPWLSQKQIRLSGPISQVDLAPTLLDLLGCEVSTTLDGRSRAAELATPSSWRPGNIMVEWHDFNIGSRPRDAACDGRSLVTADGWKLNLFRGDGPEMYDLNSDPDEMRNLGRDPGRQEKLRVLSAEIRAWQVKHHDDMPLQFA